MVTYLFLVMYVCISYMYAYLLSPDFDVCICDVYNFLYSRPEVYVCSLNVSICMQICIFTWQDVLKHNIIVYLCMYVCMCLQRTTLSGPPGTAIWTASLTILPKLETILQVRMNVCMHVGTTL